MIVAVRDHVYQEVGGGSKEEAENGIADCAADCRADGSMGGKRHNGHRIAHLEIFGECMLECSARRLWWRNGIRDGLKIRFPQGIEGSSPSRSTTERSSHGTFCSWIFSSVG